MSSLRQHYTRARGAESRLYNGPEYVDYVKRHINGHQFLGPNELQLATVEYGGAIYERVPLRYDLVKDKLVVQWPMGMVDLALVNDNVRRFAIGPRHFVRLVAVPLSSPDSAGNGLARTGFYELLVDGPVQMLALRRKELQERAVAGRLEGSITQKNEFFICKEQRYYKVAKAGAVLAVFPESKVALRKYVRSEKLKFGEAYREASLLALMRYHATLAAAPN
jgi:hypothetical protein